MKTAEEILKNNKITLHAIKFKDLKMGESFKHYNGSDIVLCIKTDEFSFIEEVSKVAHYINSMNEQLVYKNETVEPEKELKMLPAEGADLTVCDGIRG